MFYYLERFYNSVGGEPYPHIDQFNLDLGQPLPPLFCFSFVYVFFMYYMYVVLFLCVHLLFYFIFSIMIICLCGIFANPPIVKFMCIFQLLRKYNLYNFITYEICLKHKDMLHDFPLTFKKNGEGKERKIHTAIKKSSLM